MQNNLVETIFEAIAIGDEASLKQCIEQATIDTVLEFRRSYGKSPLHLCVKNRGINYLGAVRCLLASGLFGSSTFDREGQSVLECALANGDNELVEALINAEIDGLDGATACYKMLRHDSLQIFEKFLLMKQFKEEEEFQHIASASVQLNVKNVLLSTKLRLYTLWKLSDYGFRQLSGNWPGTKDANEWKNHIDVISDCWGVIRVRHDTQLYADVDELFLHRLQTVHNHLYFLKHIQFLAYLPMQEATFCVAIFLSIYRNPNQFQDYRLMINKCQVIEFVRMISEQLAIMKKYLEGTEAELFSIVRNFETSSAAEKNEQIAKLLAKMESSNQSNKVHELQKLTKRVQSATAAEKDRLIKDMLDKVKGFDKPWAEAMAEDIKALNNANREQLIDNIRDRLRHLSHPQNVVNRLMGGLKKGKATETIVADIVSGESFNLSHLMRSEDRRIKRKLVKCYCKTKQYYSLYKAMFCCENILEPNGHTSQITYVEIACMKRSVQIFGEAIKNTANSANMPGKAGVALGSILTRFFPFVSTSFREVLSHSISLKRKLLGESLDKWMFESYLANMGMMKMAFNLLYVVAIADVQQSFYSCLRQCDTLEKLRSLALYAGDMEHLEQRQLARYKQVTEYFIQAEATFEECEKKPFGKTPNFRQMQQQLQCQRNIVNKFSEYLNENDDMNYKVIQRACLSSDDLASVRRLLSWKLRTRCVDEFFDQLYTWWRNDDFTCVTTEWVDSRLLRYVPFVNFVYLGIGSNALQCIEEFGHIAHTRQMTQDLGIADMLDEEALQHLNTRLKPYYDNIFFINNKWDVLKKLCKERKLPWNEELTRGLIKSDQDQLQQLYDNNCKQLAAILEKYGLHTVDGLVTNMFDFPSQMLSAIEHIQLELCEMLYAVEYFGDSFHYLKSRIPMIQGKNYRNFLAHDTLSYNLLTDCSIEKVIINAFVFSKTSVQLFDNHTKNAKNAQINVPTLSEMHHWVELQKRLLEAFQTKDVQSMHAIVLEGGEMKGRFCCTQNKTYLASAFFGLPELINPCNIEMSVVEYLDQYFAGFLNRCNDPKNQLTMALTFRDFQAACNCIRTKDLFSRRRELMMRDEMFDWNEHIVHFLQTDKFISASLENKGYIYRPNITNTILRMLIEHGNIAGVKKMLPSCESFHTAHDYRLLGDALLYCVRAIGDLLQSVPYLTVLFLAIIVQRDDIFTNMMAEADIEENTFQRLLRTAIQARNSKAAEYLLKNESYSRFIPGAFAFECCKSAARMGEQSTLEHLLVRCPTTSIANGSLAEILRQAALKQRWNCVQLLLDRDIPVDVVIRDKPLQENCTLLVLVKYGQCRLLQRIKSVQHEQFKTVVIHPFVVAIVNGMTSDRMIRTLRALGFDWLDSSITLHAAIISKNRNLFGTIQKLVNEQCAVNPSAHHDHFRQALIVLQRWKMLSFVEESTLDGNYSLYCALKNGDQAMVQELLRWARQMRTIEELGVLGGIVFERELVYTCFGERVHGFLLKNTRYWCEEMITRMETYALRDKMKWQQFTINTQSSTPVLFYALIAEDKVISPFHQDQTFILRESATLMENLADFPKFNCPNNTAIYFAQFVTTGGAMRYFWQIDQIRCMYDIAPSPENGVDLTDMVNYRNWYGDTPLHDCFGKNALTLVKILVENGANPLLANDGYKAAIDSSLLNSEEYAVGRYLFDECVRRDLRDEKGCSVLELYNNDGARLLHIAVMAGRQDIIQRLLDLHVDVSVVNNSGVTPAHLAASINIYGKCHIVKMILDRDSSSIDIFDNKDSHMLQCAARDNSLELLQLILQYKPNLQKNRNGMMTLGISIENKHIELAKCLLNYAIENNIQGITLTEKADLVVMSLLCNDYELSKMLLEYELGHTLEEADERDLPRIKSILEGSVPKQPTVSIALKVQMERFTESQNFLEELLILATTRDQ